LADALKCIELDESFVRGYFRAATCYYEMGDYDNSLALITKYKGDDKDLDELLGKVKVKMQEEEILFKSKNVPKK
jgi:hypothetical protein